MHASTLGFNADSKQSGYHSRCMTAATPIQRLDSWQQRHTPLALLVATVKKASDDQASNLAVVVAFYAFFSIFPLLLVFVTVLGYVLAGDPSLMRSVSRSVLGSFPVIGSTLHQRHLRGDALALVVGIVLSLWSGSAVTGAMSNALEQIWEVPRAARTGFIKKKVRGLGLLAGLALLFFLASGASGLVGGGLDGAPLVILGLAVSVLVNLCLFLASFRLLCAWRAPWRELLPGAVAAALVWTLLQAVGGIYVGHIAHSDTAYGTFAVVLGILAWLQLGCRITLYCAELNTVIAGRRWPRSLLGSDQPAGARRLGGPAVGQQAQTPPASGLPPRASPEAGGDQTAVTSSGCEHSPP